MYKIVLCYPSCDKENKGTELLYSPLALAYLARHTPRHFSIMHFDEYVGEDMDPEQIEADIVAFSSLSSGMPRAIHLSEQLRKKGILTVIGGAHATALPVETGQYFDVVIKGEGEIPWRTFLHDYEQGTLQKEYFGRMDVSLADLGTPDRRYIHANYHYPSLMTSRGCPFHCSFCYLTVYKNRKFRTIPHNTVLEDLENLRGNKIIVVTDENFIGYSEVDYKNRKALLQKMIDRDFGFTWGCQASTNIAYQTELLKLMYKAGCRAIFIGFEANDEEALKSINKKQNLATDFKDIVHRIHQQKIAVIASTILGLDNQKKGYHKTLIRELKRIKADYVRVFFMTAWPGTPLFKSLKKEERVCEDWSRLRKDIPTVVFKQYSHAEIIEARNEVIGYFFSAPHILRTIWRWIWIDRSLIGLLLKMWWRNKVSEKIRNERAVNKKDLMDFDR